MLHNISKAKESLGQVMQVTTLLISHSLKVKFNHWHLGNSTQIQNIEIRHLNHIHIGFKYQFNISGVCSVYVT